MGLFRRRINTKTRDTRVDLHGTQPSAKSFAQERVRKVTANKTVQVFRAIVAILLITVLGTGLVGFIGLIAYSLKSGTDLSLNELRRIQEGSGNINSLLLATT